jgi:hypothetical protein
MLLVSGPGWHEKNMAGAGNYLEKAEIKIA